MTEACQWYPSTCRDLYRIIHTHWCIICCMLMFDTWFKWQFFIDTANWISIIWRARYVYWREGCSHQGLAPHLLLYNFLSSIIQYNSSASIYSLLINKTKNLLLIFLVVLIQLDLRVNHTLIKDNFLWVRPSKIFILVR